MADAISIPLNDACNCAVTVRGIKKLLHNREIHFNYSFAGGENGTEEIIFPLPLEPNPDFYTTLNEFLKNSGCKYKSIYFNEKKGLAKRIVGGISPSNNSEIYLGVGNLSGKLLLELLQTLFEASFHAR